MTRGFLAGGSRRRATEPSALWIAWLQPARLFLLLAAVAGLCLCLLTAPFQSPDERAHFYRAYQISEGQFAPVARDRYGGADLPASVQEVGDRFDTVSRFERLQAAHPKAKKSDVKFSWAEIGDALRVPLNPQQRKFTRTVAEIYSPMPYIPQASALFIGRHLGLGPLVLMYLGRIANLFFWIALNYLTLRITPTCRRPLVLLLLMPMTLFQAASNSCDPTANALAVLLAAMVLRYVCIAGNSDSAPREIPGTSSARVGFRACVVFAVIAIILALTKFVYLPILALLLLIPPSRLGGPRRYFIVIATIGVLSIAALLLWTLPTVNLDMVVIDKPGISAAGQKEFLRAHPTRAWAIFVATIIRRGPAIVESFVGRLGWLDTPLSKLFVFPYLIILSAACWLQPLRIVFSRRLLAPILLICLSLSILAIGSLNYIYDNLVGNPLVEGIQGRYLIPLAPAMIVLLWAFAPARARQIARDIPAKIDLGVAVAVVISCLYTLVVVYFRYHGVPNF